MKREFVSLLFSAFCVDWSIPVNSIFSLVEYWKCKHPQSVYNEFNFHVTKTVKLIAKLLMKRFNSLCTHLSKYAAVFRRICFTPDSTRSRKRKLVQHSSSLSYLWRLFHKQTERQISVFSEVLKKKEIFLTAFEATCASPALFALFII